MVTESLAPGTHIGPYMTLFRLGKGGMGEVWAAQSQGSGRRGPLVALKVLHRNRVSKSDLLLFMDEATAASALNHPAIVSTYSRGRDEERLYIAMELIRGPSLTALLQRLAAAQAQFEPELVVHIGLQIASALDYGYNQATHNGQKLRLIHRDVSPHNILLDLSGRVRLADFGVARTSIQHHKSWVGTVRGKPSYMAPEQAMGGTIDARTDVFALGTVMYESAALTRLFGRDKPIKSMHAVVHYHPVPLTDLAPHYPSSLARILAKALEKKPDDRFDSAASMVAALRDVARELPNANQAQQRLANKICEHFDPRGFDAEEQANESLALIEAKTLEPPVETRFVPTKLVGSSSHLQATSYQGTYAPTRIWPSSNSSDPLDPKIIRNLRTQIVDENGSLKSGSYMNSTWSSSSEGRTTLPVGPTMAALLLLLVVGVAGLAGFTAAWFFRTRPQPIVHTTYLDEPAKPPIQLQNLPRAEERHPTTNLGSTSKETITEKNQHHPSPTSLPKKSLNRRRPPPRRSAAQKQRRSSPRAQRQKSNHQRPATYDEVRNLIRRVKRLNPEAAEAMLITLIEAGPNNTSALNRLRRQAEKVLH